MRRRTDTSLVAYLAALALTLSTIESSLPHAIPFLRLGLANLALLWALDRLSARDYLLLAALKWVTSSLMSGLLFSPYAIVSLAGTAASAIVMLASHRLLGRWSTLWSHSTLGSIASGASQLAASSLFLTDTVLRLMPLMLAFNIASGIVIAALAYVLEPARQVEFENGCQEKSTSWLTLLPPALAIVAIALTEDVAFLTASFALSLLFCHMCGRRIRPGFYIVSIITVILFNLLSPSGRVLFSFVTAGALEDGIARALRLSSLVALSQGIAALPVPMNGIVARSLAAYGRLSSVFVETDGGIRTRIAATLAVDAFPCTPAGKEEVSTRKTVTVCMLLIVLSAISNLI